MADSQPVIAIDGHSSCGKSTVAKALAKKLGLRYIDSGAMYRAVALYFLRNKIALDKADYSADISKIRITFKINPATGYSDIYLNSENVSDQIRTMEVSDVVSKVSALKQVRKAMVALQQEMNHGGGLVMDGRDIGTTVFPEADLKIFMTADTDVRAARRFRELHAKGQVVTLQQVRENIESRDYEDSHRKESPLVKAKDAVVLDNSHLDQEEQLQFVLNALAEKAQRVSTNKG